MHHIWLWLGFSKEHADSVERGDREIALISMKEFVFKSHWCYWLIPVDCDPKGKTRSHFSPDPANIDKLLDIQRQISAVACMVY